MIAWAVYGGLSLGALVCVLILGWGDNGYDRALRAIEQDLWDRLAVGACEWIP